MNRRLPLRYAGWVARDTAVRPGLASLAIAALFTFVYSRFPAGARGSFPAAPQEFLIRTVGQFDWLLVLIATAGIVSWDRASGYYRSLFSQPVNPGLYYLQRWLFGALGVAAFVPLVGLGILLISGSFPYSGPLLVQLLLKYLLLGGTTFLLSTLIRVDWLVAFLLSALQSVLHGLDRAGAALNPFTKLVLHLLPPFDTGAPIRLGGLAYPSQGELLHAVLYGAGLLILALAVLALRPLGSGGRA